MEVAQLPKSYSAYTAAVAVAVAVSIFDNEATSLNTL